ncbi:MAG: glycosyltransferase family 2 protein [Candidatus Moranbacteria bacterium]|nr:glycosyltransferase family 2 protein [Candidatus Moranbacteria bacterium]
MQTSIIIRTKNEEKYLGQVLEKLKNQTYQDFEIIIVDSGSTDQTLKIAEKYLVKIFHIKPEEFNYPFASNFGARKSEASKYLVYLSAHSLPISNTWLENGISDFTSEKVCGVYGNVWALPDASIWEKIIFNKWIGKLEILLKKKYVINESRMGVLGCTNAIIRKDLWKRNNFDKSYGLGGEDGVWANYWLEKGYEIIRDSKFSVYHSHGLGFFELIEQSKYWKTLGKPQPFEFPEFRK